MYLADNFWMGIEHGALGDIILGIRDLWPALLF